MVYDAFGPSGPSGPAIVIGVIRNWSTQAREAVSARPDRVRSAVEATLALLLIVQLGRLVWIAVEPVDVPAAEVTRPQVRAADYSVFQRFDAFFRTGGQSSLAEDTASHSGQMRLFGVRSDGAGGGSAIIGLAAGRQLSVAVGERLEPGLILQSVGADHVVLARGGSLSRLIFSDLPAGDPASLVAEASLRPRMQGLKMNGLTITSNGEAPALAAAGLKSGDVILAVNGQPLDRPDRIAALRGQLAGRTSAEIRFERDGAVQTTTIRTGR